jgi:hypothetical protein
MFSDLLRDYPAQSHIFKAKIKSLVGDYTINEGLSDEAYNQLEQEALSFRNMLD